MNAIPSIPAGFFHYSFLDGSLVGSEYPAVLGNPKRVIAPMVASGIRALLTLTPSFQDFHEPAIAQFHIPIEEMPSRQQIADAIAIIDRHLNSGQGIWVHCQHGIDRTGCVIGSYLATIGQPADRVIAELYAKFPERRRNARMIALWEPYEKMIRSFAKPPSAGTPASPSAH
jgi:hypothetical protein